MQILIPFLSIWLIEWLSMFVYVCAHEHVHVDAEVRVQLLRVNSLFSPCWLQDWTQVSLATSALIPWAILLAQKFCFFFFNFYFSLQANVNTYWGFKLNPYFHEEIDTRWLHLFNREKLGFFCILNKLTEQNNIARAMAQSVRCLLCKHEHPGLVPRTPVISQAW